MEKNIRLLKQPAYSPDVNMCDRFVFPRLEALRETEEDFVDKADLETFLREHLPSFTSNMMDKEFEKMKKHIDLIIQKEGHYV